MEKAAWLAQVLGVEIANPRAARSDSDPSGALSDSDPSGALSDSDPPGGLSDSDPPGGLSDSDAPGGANSSMAGAPNLASADRKSVSVQIVNTTQVALTWNGTTYDPASTTIIGTASSDLPPGGNISFAVNYRTVDDSGQPALLPFAVHFTGQDAVGANLSVTAGFTTSGTAIRQNCSASPDPYTWKTEGSDDGQRYVLAGTDVAEQRRKTVTLQIVNSSGVDLAWNGTTYDPATVEVVGQANGPLPADGSITLVVNYREADQLGNSAMQPFIINYTGQDAGGGTFQTIVGFRASGANVNPHWSNPSDAFQWKSEGGDRALHFEFVAADPPQLASPQPDAPQPQPNPPQPDPPQPDPPPAPPSADQLTTVTLQVANQTDFDLTFNGGRYDPGTMFPKPGLPSGIAAGETMALTVDFTTTDAQGSPADKGFYLVFTGSPPAGGTVSLDCGFVYTTDGKLVPQGSVDGGGYTATRAGDNTSATITLAASQPEQPA